MQCWLDDDVARASAVLRGRTITGHTETLIEFWHLCEAGGAYALWENDLKITALLTVFFVAGACPAMAHQHYQNSDASGKRSGINCEMIRAYVDQVGLVQAKALARSAGMTASQERRARRCLAKKV